MNSIYPNGPETFLWISFFLLSGCFNSLAAQTLIYNEMQQDGVGGVNGLDGAYGIVVSPDGKHVYSASSVDDAVTVFSRNASTGDLTYVETQLDDAQVGGTIDGLFGGKRLTISSDGNHLYVPASSDDAVVVFSRNATSGELTYVETQRDGVGGVDGLDGATQAVLSPDDKHLYVVGSVDDAVAVFLRNSITGALVFVEIHVDGISGVDGLNSPNGIIVAPDGNHVYVASSIDDAIAVFSRNSITGALTYVEMQQDGVSGVDGLNGAYGVFVSPDNKHLYAASSSDDAVAAFSRNLSTGALTYVEVHKDDTQGGSITNLNAARAVTGTSDGNYIFLVSSSDDGLVVFDRNSSTGALTLNEEHKDAVSGVDGLDGARFVALSNDDQNLYVVSSTDDAIAVFDLGPSLPVELLYFEVDGIAEKVAISWATATETNNDYFTIERSEDAQNWNELTQVKGAGNSTRVLNYEVLDENPLAGTSYYRLKQTDFDEGFSYSQVKSINLSKTSPGQLFIYPNPTQSRITIEGNQSGIETLSIYNMNGQEITSQIIMMKMNESASMINLENLPPGIYTLMIQDTPYKVYKQ